jgi:hypothetical protein
VKSLRSAIALARPRTVAVLLVSAATVVGVLAVSPASHAMPRQAPTAVTAGARTSAASSAAADRRCLAPKPVTSAPTRFGVSLGASPTLADDRRTEEARFGKLPIVRIFDPSIPPANAWERRKPQLAGMQITTSFRMPPAQVLAGRYDSALARFFRTAPRNRAVYWTYFHEPEPNIDAHQFTAEQYRRAWRHIGQIAARYCRPNLHPTLILTGWTAEAGSGRDWRDYSPGRRYLSVLAWDPYNKAVGTPASYRAPSQVFGAVVRASRAWGKAWAITETGTARTHADSASTGRAAWIKAMGSYLRRHGALFVTYFQSTNRGDFELRDAPSIRAYRALVNG